MNDIEFWETIIHGMESGGLVALMEDGEPHFYLWHQLPAEAKEEAISVDVMRRELEQLKASKLN